MINGEDSPKLRVLVKVLIFEFLIGSSEVPKVQSKSIVRDKTLGMLVSIPFYVPNFINSEDKHEKIPSF